MEHSIDLQHKHMINLVQVHVKILINLNRYGDMDDIE